jgi:hypothetical protein
MLFFNIYYVYLQLQDKWNYYVLPNETGWMTIADFEHICMEYLFPSLIKKRDRDLENKDKHILIITDNHKSRLNRPLMEYSQKQKIDFITIPAYTSHILQPLDRGVNGVFKNSFCQHYLSPAMETQTNIRAAIVEASIVVLLYYIKLYHTKINYFSIFIIPKFN